MRLITALFFTPPALMKKTPVTTCARRLPRCLFLLLIPFSTNTVRALDANGNGLNDIWEIVYGAQSLAAAADTDGDGASNLDESNAGTNPFDPNSRPGLGLNPAAGQLVLSFPRVPGKRYTLESKSDLAQPAWTVELVVVAQDNDIGQYTLALPAGKKFWRIGTDDVDTDGDGLNDAEERWLGFDPASSRSARNDTADLSRVTTGLNTTSTVTVGVLGNLVSERWPDPGVFVLRRSGGLKPLTVNISFTGTATRNSDYTDTAGGNTVSFPAGVREVAVSINPVADFNDAEPAETVTLTALTGAGYTLGSTVSGSLSLENEPANSLPHAKACARFLIQAAFGPDQDSPADADIIPENVEEVMAMGFDAWIEDQFTRPPGLIQPFVDWATENNGANSAAVQLYGNYKEFAWWNRAMGVAKLRPDAASTVASDPLRQRIAFALSQIIVVGDRPEQLAVEQVGMANFYDLFVKHAFGNYRDLLHDAALHPCMGIYLSHLGNVKANPATNVFPDENFAREIMQLFTIGLWQLGPDGGRVLVNGQPVPTYTNADITELARVFTGLSFGNNTSFQLHPRDFTVPMKGWDAFHDCGSKSLLGSLTIPARTATAGNTGGAALADVNDAVNFLFNHPNTGPFICKQLIQKMITSNPSPEYVSRVVARFNDNGAVPAVRGDMKAVIRAILLDNEARNPAMRDQPTWGKLREPFLRCVNFARAFNATAPSGFYALDQFTLAHAQDPMNSPSVFNFFTPGYSPPGPLTEQGKVAPEFQVLNATTAMTGANYFWEHTLTDLHYYGSANPANSVALNLNDELAYLVPAAQIAQNQPAGPALDPDPLLRRLDLALTGGTLSPAQFQIIREAMLRVQTYSWQWHRSRLQLAIYLITTSSDFNVQR